MSLLLIALGLGVGLLLGLTGVGSGSVLTPLLIVLAGLSPAKAVGTSLVALVANLFLPWGIASGPSIGGLLIGVASLAAKMVVIATGVSLVEVRTAKLRLFRVPELLAGAVCI